MSIQYEIRDKVARVFLNRPGVLNALNSEMFRRLAEVWEDFNADPKASVLIVAGRGNRAFCVGADLKEWQQQGRDFHASGLVDRIQSPMRRTDTLKPVIAAIHGYCLGGGLELALACDIRLASETAVFGLPEIRLGVFPGQGATQRLPRMLPYNLAAEMLLTGENISAHEAWRIGLINRLVSPETLMEEAEKTAAVLAEKSLAALTAAKDCLLKSYELPLKAGLLYEAKRRKEVAWTREDAMDQKTPHESPPIT